ncbi:MAG: NERD domain-containing protein [Clostridia bacterium]|nr:NERD domain-containing protein [Clostridia bacterium]
MDFIRILIIVAVVAVVGLIIAALISAFYHSQRNRARKAGKLTPRRELEAFLLDTNYRRNVFSHLYFPVIEEGTAKPRHYQRIDEVVVTKGGVLILTVFDKNGRIDNSGKDTWIQIKDDERFEIESPLITAEKNKDLIRVVLKRAGYGKVPIYSTVVFMHDDAIPLSGYDDMIYMSELEKLLRDMNKMSVLGGIEQFYVCRALKSSGLSRQTIIKNKL